MITVAWMTWIEIVRRRIFLVTLLMTVFFFGIYILALHAMVSTRGVGSSESLLDNYERALTFLGICLYVANLIVAYLSIFSAAGTISAEIESGLLLAILPRPIRRWRVYMGKWLGYCTWSMVYGLVVFWAAVLIIHFYFSFPIDSAAMWKACGVFELIPATLVSLTTLGSIYFPALGNGIGMTLLVGVSMIGGFIERVSPSDAQTAMDKIGLITSLILPSNAAYYRVMSEMLGPNAAFFSSTEVNNQLGPFGGGPTPSNAFLVYIGVYIAVTVALGATIFSRRDV